MAFSLPSPSSLLELPSNDSFYKMQPSNKLSNNVNIVFDYTNLCHRLHAIKALPMTEIRFRLFWIPLVIPKKLRHTIMRKVELNLKLTELNLFESCGLSCGYCLLC